MPDLLPHTPGSIAEDRRGHRYGCALWFGGLLRWAPLTRWGSRPLTPEELDDLDPTVLYVAPDWTDPDPLKEHT